MKKKKKKNVTSRRKKLKAIWLYHVKNMRILLVE